MWNSFGIIMILGRRKFTEFWIEGGFYFLENAVSQLKVVMRIIRIKKRIQGERV